MSVTAEDLLNQLEQEIGADDSLGAPQGLDAESMLTKMESVYAGETAPPPPAPAPVSNKKPIRNLRDVTDSLNQGLLLPVTGAADVIDWANRKGTPENERLGGGQPHGDSVRQLLHEWGLLAAPGEERNTWTARGLNYFGTALLMNPFLKITPGSGAAATSLRSANVPSSVAMDLSSSFGAAYAGTFAEDELNLGPGWSALFEISGGMIHPGSILNTMARRGSAATRAVTDKLRGSRGDHSVAARTVQDVSDDAGVAANRIDPNNPMPATRQIGDEGTLQLERAILRESPGAQIEFSKQVDEALNQSYRELQAIGDSGDAAAVITRQRDHLIGLLEQRSSAAAQDAIDAINRLGPDADPRQISRAVRDSLEGALKDARVAEAKAWQRVNPAASVGSNGSNIRGYITKYDESQSAIPGVRDETLVPGYVRALMKGKTPLTVRDIQTARSRLGSDLDKARVDGDRNRVRMLGEMREALLQDLETANTTGLKTATAVSRKLNQKFTQGEVGKLLSFESGRVSRIDAPNSVPFILNSKAPGRALQQAMAASPETGAMFSGFMQASYYSDVVSAAADNPSKFAQLHRSFMKKWKDRGVFEQMPQLEQQFNNVNRVYLKDAAARERLKIARDRGGARMGANANKSISAAYLGEDGVLQLQSLVDDPNATKTAATLLRRMGNDAAAKQGLKAGFVDTLFARSTSRTGQIDQKMLTKLLTEQADTMRALGFSGREMTRVNNVLRAVRQANLRPVGRRPDVVSDEVGFAMDLLASLIGAKAGQNVAGSGLGSSLVMAGKFSEKMSEVMRTLVKRDGVKAILAAAVTDNNVYRALLVRATDTPAKQEAAANVLRAWIPAVAAQETLEGFREN